MREIDSSELNQREAARFDTTLTYRAQNALTLEITLWMDGHFTCGKSELDALHRWISDLGHDTQPYNLHRHMATRLGLSRRIQCSEHVFLPKSRSYVLIWAASAPYLLPGGSSEEYHVEEKYLSLAGEKQLCCCH